MWKLCHSDETGIKVGSNCLHWTISDCFYVIWFSISSVLLPLSVAFCFIRSSSILTRGSFKAHTIHTHTGSLARIPHIFYSTHKKSNTYQITLILVMEIVFWISGSPEEYKIVWAMGIWCLWWLLFTIVVVVFVAVVVLVVANRFCFVNKLLSFRIASLQANRSAMCKHKHTCNEGNVLREPLSCIDSP